MHIKKINDIQIICPFCFESFKRNNVVFRRDSGDRGDDYYNIDYNFRRNNEININLQYGFIDPANLTQSKKVIDRKNKRITGVKDESGHTVEKKLCPYCHNALPPLCGDKKMHFISVIGFTNSGKTTYLAALYHQLFNNERNIDIMKSFGDDYIEDNLKLFLKGVNPQNTTATKDLLGPYIYTIKIKDNLSNNKKMFSDCDYVIYDIPGEKFKDKEWIKSNAGFINKSDSVIFLIDPLDLSGVKIVSECLYNIFGDNCKQNVAIVINKIDQLFKNEKSKETNKLKELVIPLADHAISSNHNYNDGSPIDWNQIEFNDSLVYSNVVEKYPELISFCSNIKSVFSKGDVKSFATYLVSNGCFNPNGSDEPFLWLISKIGMYPKKYISSETKKLNPIKSVLTSAKSMFAGDKK